MGLAEAAKRAATALERLTRGSVIRAAPSGGNANLDERLADAVRRGQMTRTLDALRRKL